MRTFACRPRKEKRKHRHGSVSAQRRHPRERCRHCRPEERASPSTQACRGAGVRQSRRSRILRRAAVVYVSLMSPLVLAGACARALARAAATLAMLAAAGCAGNPGPGSAEQPLDLVVAATTDVHGRLTGWDYYAVAPTRFAVSRAPQRSSIRFARANPDRVVLVDAGDLLQGNPLAFVAARVDTARPHPVIAAMNVMRYDAVGDRQSRVQLRARRRSAARSGRRRFPFLAANAYLANGGRAYPAFVIVEARRRPRRHRRRDDARLHGLGSRQPSRTHRHSRHRAGGSDRRRRGARRRRRRHRRDDAFRARRRIELRHRDHWFAGGERRSASRARGAGRRPHRVRALAPGSRPTRVIGSTRLMQPKNWATSVAVAHLGLERDGRTLACRAQSRHDDPGGRSHRERRRRAGGRAGRIGPRSRT